MDDEIKGFCNLDVASVTYAMIILGISVFLEAKKLIDKHKEKRETGIEPATPSLARRCSTAEPLARMIVFLRTNNNIHDIGAFVNSVIVLLYRKFW